MTLPWSAAIPCTNGITASAGWTDGGQGPKPASPVRPAQPFEARPACPASLRCRGRRPRVRCLVSHCLDNRPRRPLFDGMPGASRLLGGRCRAGMIAPPLMWIGVLHLLHQGQRRPRRLFSTIVPGCTVWILSNTRNGNETPRTAPQSGHPDNFTTSTFLAHQSTHERRRLEQQHHPVVCSVRFLVTVRCSRTPGFR